ncbi:ATP-binding cassette domain-containing protein [Mycobacterium nebraskense]|uniref:ABC transporter n=1 Tax=Mycobacterium nebraskense TaxID=244292 RepID=A0A1X1YUP3_9MYCO|nr:ATP-binding cassette domain-containing protein [Mycobacterium nebraskense]MBI2695699.1 ATP-binding cassette domain-containing protein [Mycobacterium nebraskense]MCV7120870.1 ATP-binding cassette domain-containing protein [Mycobacterium nebraskense]ORW14681.1 ABC transporter [Mycobacterium nebraskense]
MRPEASAFRASPLTVWVGSIRFDFAPGRDVIVGYGPACDIALERLGNPPSPLPPPRPEVVLRFAGTQWVAIDLSHNGIFVDGARASTVNIRNGQAISIGDPQRGPRLVFQTGHPAGPPAQAPRPAPRPPAYPPQSPPPPPVAPPPARPNDPSLRAPTQRDTQRMRVLPEQPPAVERPAHPMPAPPVQPTAAADAQEKGGPGLIERMITSKLRVARPSFRTAEPNATYRLPLKADARTVGMAAYQLGLTVDGREVLSGISFAARPGIFTAVVGPSAARNSALLGLLAGTRRLSSGRVTVDGHDVHAEPESMRTRIGIVSPDDRLHRQLTVERALGYAAKMRLPQDISPEQRDRVVTQVLEELELTEHRATRIGKLSPEVRRCAALAIELITRPTLLVVDEPNAGLDAEQQRHVMAMLRRQADIGCVVVAAMSSQTSLTDLDLCDQVLVLTSAGTAAFLGPPLQIEPALGTADWSTVLARVGADPDAAHRAFRARPPGSALTAPPEVAAPSPPPAGSPATRQIRLLARRDVRLLFADRLHFAFLAILPFVLAGLTLLIPGDSGLARPHAGSAHPHEAIEILAALNIAAVIIGTALTVRAVVREQRIFRREQALGLSTAAYLAAKILVFGLAAAILTAIVFAIVVTDKGGPVRGAALLHNATVELYVSVGVTAIVSAAIGLALSTLGSSTREVLPLLLPVVLASALFNGSLVQLVSQWGFQQISWFVPAQWGFAASASTVNLRRVDPLAADSEMWTHYSGWWVFDMTMLVLFGVAAAGFTLYRLRPEPREAPRPSHREQQELSDLTR